MGQVWDKEGLHLPTLVEQFTELYGWDESELEYALQCIKDFPEDLVGWRIRKIEL